jgi:hypothetical protein
MDKKLKARWIKALESGKYKQGRKRLKHGGRFCCLGVLREIEPSIKGVDQDTALDEESGIPMEYQSKLIDLNDGSVFKGIDPHSFKEIAKWIRSHL